MAYNLGSEHALHYLPVPPPRTEQVVDVVLGPEVVGWRRAYPRRRVDAFVDWIYRELFRMPPDDPALGLDVPDPFIAVA